jgi:hypothetical protein
LPADLRFEGVLWLQGVQFVYNGMPVAPKRLLMIDDLHKLRRAQRRFLISELTELRPRIPVWLAERNIALVDDLLSQGARNGRDLREYSLEQLWADAGGQQQFVAYAQSILDRRLADQTEIPAGAFAQYLRDRFLPEEFRIQFRKHASPLQEYAQRYKKKILYKEWAERAEILLKEGSFESVREFYTTQILIHRHEAKRQMALELIPLGAAELEDKENSQIQRAAEIFMHEAIGIPYYFGLDRLCIMATYNVEELLGLAAALFEALVAKQVLRKPELLLSPQEQERLLYETARHKRDFIPKSHTEGTRAQRLLDAIGVYCRDRTFLPNAPYAPGVTGIRLSQRELVKLDHATKGLANHTASLKKILAECVAENLLMARPSAASVNRESGTIFYLNRTLCAYYGLPLQLGGWQDVTTETLIEWLDRTPISSRRQRLELN